MFVKSAQLWSTNHEKPHKRSVLNVVNTSVLHAQGHCHMIAHISHQYFGVFLESIMIRQILLGNNISKTSSSMEYTQNTGTQTGYLQNLSPNPPLPCHFFKRRISSLNFVQCLLLTPKVLSAINLI